MWHTTINDKLKEQIIHQHVGLIKCIFNSCVDQVIWAFSCGYKLGQYQVFLSPLNGVV